MDNLLILLMMISMLAMIVFITLAIKDFIKKKSTGKHWRNAGISFIATIALVFIYPTVVDSTQAGESSSSREEAGAVVSELFEEEEFDPTEYRTDLTFENLARTPDDYYNEKITLSGTVLQVMEKGIFDQMRVAIDDDYDQVVLIEYLPILLDEHLLEDDYITFYGTYLGTTTYENVMGVSRNMPTFKAGRNIEFQ